MKKGLLSLAIVFSCSITCFSQEITIDTLVQISASKIILQADHPKDEKPVYVQFRNKSNDLRTSKLLITYDDKKKHVIVEGGKKVDQIEASFRKDAK